MSPAMVGTLVVLAFLIFMTVVLLYIKIAVRKEIQRTQLHLIVRFAVEQAHEMYNMNEWDRGEKVDRISSLIREFINDWNLEVEYDKYQVQNRVRRLL